jgi:hypothetical protein
MHSQAHKSLCNFAEKSEIVATLKVEAWGSQQTHENDNSVREPLLRQGSLTYYMDMREEEEVVVAKDQHLTKTSLATMDVFASP